MAMDTAALDCMVEKSLEEMRVKVGPEKPIALALTGSRAAGYANGKSDYDFFAVFGSDIKLHYCNFRLNGDVVSVKVEGSERFERRLQHHSSFMYVEGGSIVMMPYMAFLGEDYLASAERKGRANMVKLFVSSMPRGKVVRVHPKMVAEWPFIWSALVWPSGFNRIKAIAESGSNVLASVVPKYADSLKQLGYRLSEDGAFYISPQDRGKGPGSSFLRGAFSKCKRFTRNSKSMQLPMLMRGALLILAQIPERISNIFYEFPKFEQKDGFLEYAGPTLEEFACSRAYLAPLRNIARDMKEDIVGMMPDC